jgi:hypothetical protein
MTLDEQNSFGVYGSTVVTPDVRPTPDAWTKPRARVGIPTSAGGLAEPGGDDSTPPTAHC